MVGRLQRENFAKAVAAGVKIAFGTDAGVYPHGDNAKQFHYMVKFGMTPAGAIRAATSSAAELIDRAKDEGTLEAGKYADLIAVIRESTQTHRSAGTRLVRDEGRQGLQGRVGRNGEEVVLREEDAGSDPGLIGKWFC